MATSRATAVAYRSAAKNSAAATVRPATRGTVRPSAMSRTRCCKAASAAGTGVAGKAASFWSHSPALRRLPAGRRLLQRPRSISGIREESPRG
ncbi:hypothetical protein ACFU9X_35650 [Streptomyces atratus]|uniref:hypothetical protein n=1 Tax=Streptomyces atratus TaxID=1893 RepID=UPI0036B3A731